MKTATAGALLTLSLVTVGPAAFAQEPPKITSPEIRPDRTVDIFLGGARDFAARLQRASVPRVFREFTGPHSLPVARTELAELLPLLFRESPTRP